MVFTELEIIRQVGIAMLLGFIIGVERESHGKPAGMRTYTLLTGAACLFTLLGFMITDSFLVAYSIDMLKVDPTRIIQAIIVGISFLGAGVILKSREDQIRNLTTAAGILIMTAVGMTVGIGEYYLAFGITMVVLTINTGILVLENKLFGKHHKGR